MNQINLDKLQLEQAVDSIRLENSSSSYVSVIRICGRPILPPLITESRRIELNRFRELAIEREKHRKASKLDQLSESVVDETQAVVKANDISPRLREPPVETDENSTTVDESTDLAQFMVNGDSTTVGDTVAHPRSPDSADTTVAESLVSILAAEPNTVPDEPVRSKLNRSDSFTLDGPSFALSERLKSMSAPLPGPESPVSPEMRENVAATGLCFANCDESLRSPSPPKQAKISSRNKGGINFSPIISEKLTEFLRQPEKVVDAKDEIIEKKLVDLTKTEKMLSDYHRLQLEELRCCQQEEAEKLLQQKKGLRNLLKHSPCGSTPAVSGSQNVSSFRSSPAIQFSTKPKTPIHICREVPSSLKIILAARVKGYLTRRLWQTERLSALRQIVKESRDQLVSIESDTTSLETDDRLKKMIGNQLGAAIGEIKTIFFDWNSGERMRLIERQRFIEAALRHKLNAKKGSFTQRKVASSGRRLSSATRKSLARKQEPNLSLTSAKSVQVGKRKRAEEKRNVTSSYSSQSSGPEPRRSHCTSSSAHPISNWSKISSTNKSLDKQKRKPWR